MPVPLTTWAAVVEIVNTVVTAPLPGVTVAGAKVQLASDGNPVYECFPFVSGYTWGPVQTADVQIASEKASSVPETY